MKILVTYKSKTGFTEKYARWIAEEIKGDLIDYQQVDKDMLKKYDLVVYCGSLHAAGIVEIKLIKENLPILRDKKVLVFAVGATPYREDLVEEIKNKNFTREQLSQVYFYYLRGGFNFSKLPTFDKLLMKLFWFMLKRKKFLSADEKGMLNAYQKPVDFTSKKNINSIVEQVRSFCS